MELGFVRSRALSLQGFASGLSLHLCLPLPIALSPGPEHLPAGWGLLRP